VLELTDLRANCAECEALCCVLLPYRRVDGFGQDKDGGTPCGHLGDSNRCNIHAELGERGWPGCQIFDCFGAGQWTTRHTYGGRSWRDPGQDVDRGEMAAVLTVQRLLHEMLWHLDEVVRRGAADQTTGELQARLMVLRDLTPEALLGADMDELLDDAGTHFEQAARGFRAGPDLRRADLSGRDLRREGLAGAGLRGALLIGADLRAVDLGQADLLGADLRGARVEGANLGEVWFLTGPQLAATRSDDKTVRPPRLR
jgi:hypothetical protein